MKTDGTSNNRLLSYGISRLEPSIQIYNSFCRKNIMDASIMSYCVPLKDLVHPFNWTEALNSNSDKDDVDKVYAVTVFIILLHVYGVCIVFKQKLVMNVVH